MNWFERYGIPGAYFYGLFFIWAYILNPCKIKIINIEQFVALVLFTFIPIGYILTIIQQFIYMQYFGMLGKTTDKIKNYFPEEANNEWRREAFHIFDATEKTESVDKLKYMQDHSRKRMDVIAINNAILSAKFIFLLTVIIFLFFLGWKFQGKTIEVIVFSAIFFFIFILILIMNNRLKDQIQYLLELMIDKNAGK